tara:strand:+ start:256 stop:498 length:243 start_codon:yes stop_codon:yes gene_type:complete
MQTELKKIISNIIVDNKLDKLKETENEIKEQLGQKFLSNNIKNIFWNQDQIVIETKTIEAKTEINLIKTKFTNKKNIKIK